MTVCHPTTFTGSPLAFLATAKHRVERRGGCCTPQRLIDAAHGDDNLHTISGGTAQADDHKLVLKTAQEPR
jgi:hypothetical protein